MKTRNITCLTASMLLATLASTTVWATQDYIYNAKVTRVLIDNTNYGGCMAAVTVDPASRLPSCGQWWVSFACVGGSDPVNSYRMLDQAQMALALNKTVSLFVNDAVKYNGYCVATRMDIY